MGRTTVVVVVPVADHEGEEELLEDGRRPRLLSTAELLESPSARRD